MARLGHLGLQSQSAVRHVHHLAARRRPAALAHAGTTARDRIQSQPHAEPGGRHRPRGVPHRVRRRSRQHLRPRLPRVERRVRALPRPQVRPDRPEGVLPALRLLQQRERVRTDSVLRRPEPHGHRHRRRDRREARRARRAHARARSAARARPRLVRSGIRGVAGAKWHSGRPRGSGDGGRAPAGTRGALPARSLGARGRVPEAGSEESTPGQEAGTAPGAGVREPRAGEGARARRRQGSSDQDRSRQVRRRAGARRRQPYQRRRAVWASSTATSRSP